MTTQIRIPEQVVPGKPLGRHIRHDPESLRYAFVAKVPAIVTTMHERIIPIFDQGSVGSCTGNATVGVLGTMPMFGVLPVGHPSLDEAEALVIYSAATKIDSNQGDYPPTDTGSDGLSVAKVATSLGLISGYQHILDLQSGLAALMTYPLITGVNWYEGFDSPDSSGLVKISGAVRGGHEFEVVGVDAEAKTVRCANSWGTGYGVAGFFSLSWDDWGRLLSEQGDATVLLPLSVPAPNPTPVPVPVVVPIPVPPTPVPTPTPTPVPVPTPLPPTPTPVSNLAADTIFAAALHPWVLSRSFCSHKMRTMARGWLTARGL